MELRVTGAREHNLKAVDLTLPLGKLVVFTGRSGSGKSSLAFDTLHAEGQRRYVEALSVRARQGLAPLPIPAADVIEGLPPTVALAQSRGRSSAPGTLAGRLELRRVLQVLFGRLGTQRCPQTGEVIQPVTHDEIVAQLASLPEGSRLLLEVPVTLGSSAKAVLHEIGRAGFSRLRVRDEVVRWEQVAPKDLEGLHEIRIVVDRIKVRADRRERLHDAVRTAGKAGHGRMVAVTPEGEWSFLDRPWSEALDEVLPELTPTQFSPQGTDRCRTCAGSGRVGDDVCGTCDGSGLGAAALAVTLGDRTWGQLWAAPVPELLAWADGLPEHPIATPLVAELHRRASALAMLGLEDLAVGTPLRHLSAGQQQRVRLAKVLGAGLSGVLVVLDEPAAGLDEAQLPALIEGLRLLCERDGNSLVVVSHRRALVQAADLVVDFGPGPGPQGGHILYAGPPDGLQGQDTPTGRWWTEGRPDFVSEAPKGTDTWTLQPVTRHGLQLPGGTLHQGAFHVVSGPSGSGKSLWLQAWSAQLAADEDLTVLDVSEAAVGRSRRSMPATYVGLWDRMRELFAQTHEAQIRGLTPSSFSLNAKGGRCESCKGLGVVRMDLGVLAPVDVVCEVCHGRRFSEDLQGITWRGLNPGEVLNLGASEAYEILAGHPRIEESLRALKAVGLGYLPLGRPTHTLSGGEAQRLKLARELTTAYRKGAHHLILIMDQPTMGLHPEDARALRELFEELKSQGATLLAASHDEWLVGSADYRWELAESRP